MLRLLTLLSTLLVASGVAAKSPAMMTLEEATPALGMPTTEEESDDEGGFWWSAGLDIASNYLWRGYDQSYTGKMFDPSLQPGITLGYGKFYLDLWFNASPISGYNEFDITLGFEHENLKVTLYDVYCDFSAPFFSKRLDNHSLTATIDYTFFERLRLHWATTFLHADDYVVRNGKERRAFSSYFEVAYTQPVKEYFDIEILAGASPFTGPFWCYAADFENIAEGFNVTNIGLRLSREFTVGVASFPVELGYTYNPTTNRHYALLKAGVWF